MYGAILGDIIGSPYEFDKGNKSKRFDLFNPRLEPHYTDDSAMTIAVAAGLMTVGRDADEKTIKKSLVMTMQDIGNRYALGNYGASFTAWLWAQNPKPYGSWGNGSAMRVSSVGWFYPNINKTREVARWTAEISHNHPEGIKGAESVASAIFLARTGKTKGEIKEYIVSEFGYDLSRTLDEIRPGYHHVESSQGTVPEAITAFLESKNFVDAIRNAVSLGGDSDTLTCITGSIAEAYYDIPNKLIKECVKRIPYEFSQVLLAFETERKPADRAYNPGFIRKTIDSLCI